MNKPQDQEKQQIKESPLWYDLFRQSGRPWITYSVIAICISICAFLNIYQKSLLYLRVVEIIVPSAPVIWSGAYWGLLTSAFVHFNLMHILFNMWWLKDFGSVLEPTMGRSKYIFFIIAAACAGSGAELAFTYQTGIGFSGVVYAMFGYIVAARSLQPLYQEVVTKKTIIWLLGWLVLCIIMTFAGAWNIANAAHIAGFLFGYFVGNAFAANVRVGLNKAGLTALVILMILSVTYMPWSDTWEERDKAEDELSTIEAKAAAGDPKAQYEYSEILLYCGEKKDAILWLRKSAAQDYVNAMVYLQARRVHCAYICCSVEKRKDQP
jgi:GlpG protein